MVKLCENGGYSSCLIVTYHSVLHAVTPRHHLQPNRWHKTGTCGTSLLRAHWRWKKSRCMLVTFSHDPPLSEGYMVQACDGLEVPLQPASWCSALSIFARHMDAWSKSRSVYKSRKRLYVRLAMVQTLKKGKPRCHEGGPLTATTKCCWGIHLAAYDRATGWGGQWVWPSWRALMNFDVAEKRTRRLEASYACVGWMTTYRHVESVSVLQQLSLSFASFWLHWTLWARK
jgi:hypothetical protein